MYIMVFENVKTSKIYCALALPTIIVSMEKYSISITLNSLIICEFI